MKNQYVGDIGDYGKYGLLRFLAQQGITVGINWYLTPNDETGHGADNQYLNDPNLKGCDRDVFDALEKIVKTYKQEERRVQMIQDARLIPGAVYYSDELDLQNLSPIDRYFRRRLWFNKSIITLKKADLIFADPDNGISYRETSRSKKNEKYVLPEDVTAYYSRGKDVVFYCHKGRRSKEAWEAVVSDITTFIPSAKVFDLTFLRGPRRSYIFVIHPEKEEQYHALLNRFTAGTWEKHFRLDDQVFRAPSERTRDEQRAVNWRVIKRFQEMYPTREMKASALKEMPNEQIQNLIDACPNIQGKIFYASFKKNEEEAKTLDDTLLIGFGFAAPAIGEVLPKGTKIIKNPDGTVTLVPPDKEDTE